MVVLGFTAARLDARPVMTRQGQADRPGTDKVMERLAERLTDPTETEEVRCACAVALGLAGRSSGIKPLTMAGAKLTRRDELVGGYTLLGRGMLGDHNILTDCRALLELEKDKSDMTGILARRAAVLGLGLCGDDEAIPLLTEAWHLNYYVNREVIFALALAGARSVADRVIRETRAPTTTPVERAYFAAVLGELFVAKRPERLDAFIAGTNYTIKDDARLPYQRLANEFLFNYLIPAFGAEWR